MKSPVRLLALRSLNFGIGVLLLTPQLGVAQEPVTRSILTIEDSPSTEKTDAKKSDFGSSTTAISNAGMTWSGATPAKLAAAGSTVKMKSHLEADLELVRDRYANGKPKSERRVTLDTQGNYVNHGEYREFSDKGELLVTGHYDQGVRTGVWAMFLSGTESQLLKTYPFTKLRPPFSSTVEFEAGQMHGVWVIADRDKRVACQVELQHGQRHGTTTLFHPNGQVYQQSSFVDGVMEGISLEKNQDGKLVREDYYTAGRKQAVETQHYSNKAVKSVVRFLTATQKIAQPDNWLTTTMASYSAGGDKEMHGEFVTYHENGQIATKGTYKNGQLHGTYESWYRTGEMAASGAYDQGQQNGQWIWRHANGMKRAIVTYDQGKPEGDTRAWDEQGKAVSFKTVSASATSPVQSAKGE